MSRSLPARSLVRTLVLTGVAQLPMLLPGISTDALGSGLLSFALLVMAAGGWAVADGRRTSWWPASVVWLVSAVGVGVLAAVLTQLSSAAYGARVSGAVLASDLAVVSPFVAGLIAVPAALGLALGRAVRPAAAR